MSNFTLKIGNLDLSPYVRVAPGDGLDVYGQGWEQPAFSAGPFADGEPLVNIDVKNREMVWPLYLNATSKDLLNSLKRQVEQEVRLAPRPLRVTWKDANASQTTFYDVAYARLDEPINYRLGEHNWSDCQLHIWCQPPYGHTATERILATGSASGPVVSVTVPAGSVAGDIGALMKLGISRNMGADGSTPSPYGGRAVIAGAVLPASWMCEVRAMPVASALAANNPAVLAPSGTGFITGDSTAVGSMVMAQSSQAILYINNPQVYPGRSRLLGIVKGSTASQQIGIRAQGKEGYLGASAALYEASGYYATSAWRICDLGIISLPTTYNAGTQTYTLNISGGLINLNELILLPEDSTFLYTPPYTTDTSNLIDANPRHTASAVGSYTANGVDNSILANRTVPLNASQTFQPTYDVAGNTVGRIPRIDPNPTQIQTVVALMHPDGINNAGMQTSVDIRVRERFTFAR